MKNETNVIHFAGSLKKKHKKLETEYTIHCKNMATLLAVLLFSQLFLHIKNKLKKLLKQGSSEFVFSKAI